MDHSALPQHQKVSTVARALQAEILRGRYGADGQLPTEPELGERFGVARETVRRALQLLKDTGVVASIQGRGTFVRRRPRRTTLQRELPPQGGPADWTDHGSEAWVALEPPAAWSRGQVPLMLTESISLENEAAVWSCVLGIEEPRVPLQLVRTYVPVDAAEKLSVFEAGAPGGAAVLERLTATGTALSWSLTDGARMPEPGEAAALDTPIGIPLIQTLRITRQGGAVVEVTEYVVSSERFRITHRPDQDADGPNAVEGA